MFSTREGMFAKMPPKVPDVWYESQGLNRWITESHVGVNPKINGAPKWMVKIRENPIKMDDLGGPPLFLETPM